MPRLPRPGPTISGQAATEGAQDQALSFKASYDAGGTWNFGLDLTETAGGGADTGMLETDLNKLARDLSEAADEEGVGLAILIDEAQPHARRTDRRCSAAHVAGQHGWSCLFALAGLPSLPRVLAEAKSYAERLFAFERIEHLTENLARKALIEPAAIEDMGWDEDAIALVVHETSGYPYFLQQFGQDTWNEAPGPAITLADARVGAARGRAALDDGFFRARWDRATRAEQRYLRAMAADADAGSSSGDVATRLGRSVNSFGPVRANLISKGLISPPSTASSPSPSPAWPTSFSANRTRDQSTAGVRPNNFGARQYQSANKRIRSRAHGPIRVAGGGPHGWPCAARSTWLAGSIDLHPAV